LINKILVGFDGTSSAERAVEFGLDLAEKYSASVLILNVIELPVYSVAENPLDLSSDVAGFAKDLRKSHQDMLARAAEKAAATKPNVKTTTEMREGNPSAQIMATATEGKFDLIILGHGRESKLQELFLGGTSERVAHRARCAVLIIK
jgi:nucleotide-binding universal stress UspA family protein